GKVLRNPASEVFQRFFKFLRFDSILANNIQIRQHGIAAHFGRFGRETSFKSSTWGTSSDFFKSRFRQLERLIMKIEKPMNGSMLLAPQCLNMVCCEIHDLPWQLQWKLRG